MGEQEYDDLLDEIYPPFVMGELSFLPSDILKSCDPIAYRCGLADWDSGWDSEEEDEHEGETDD